MNYHLRNEYKTKNKTFPKGIKLSENYQEQKYEWSVFVWRYRSSVFSELWVIWFSCYKKKHKTRYVKSSSYKIILILIIADHKILVSGLQGLNILHHQWQNGLYAGIRAEFSLFLTWLIVVQTDLSERAGLLELAIKNQTYD